MRGLELSRRFWERSEGSLLEGLPGEVRAQAAFGLVGAGSECLGFDDDLSRDHDFGPGFCVWLPAGAHARWGEELARRYARLPRSLDGVERRETPQAGQRVGVFETGAFYRGFTGLDRVPETSREWLAIPEQLLAMATNGEVFRDEEGAFSAIRAGLLGFYPEPVVRKKLAADCASMAQAGQYNLPRCLSRGDLVAAGAARSEFVMSLMASLHLLARTYMPFYKWAWRSLAVRAGVPESLARAVRAIAACEVAKVRQEDVERLCDVVRLCVERLGWASAPEGFLLDVAEQLMEGLDDAYLRSCPLGMGVFS